MYIALGVTIWVVYPTTLVAATIPVQHIAPPVLVNATTISGQPERILVERLGIDLAVVNGKYDAVTDSWTLTEDKAQFATMTQLPNNQYGSTFIYGHNTDKVFAKLAGLKAGDLVKVTTTNGHTFSYVYNGQEIVQPDNTTVLSEVPSRPRLTLMTCEGIFSQTRRIMLFDFKGVA